MSSEHWLGSHGTGSAALPLDILASMQEHYDMSLVVLDHPWPVDQNIISINQIALEETATWHEREDQKQSLYTLQTPKTYSLKLGMRGRGGLETIQVQPACNWRLTVSRGYKAVWAAAAAVAPQPIFSRGNHKVLVLPELWLDLRSGSCCCICNGKIKLFKFTLFHFILQTLLTFK